MSQSTIPTSDSSQTAPQPRRIHHTKMPTLAFELSEEVDRYVAGQIATLIREKKGAGQNAVLGLATGSTPIGVYRELIRLHEEEGLDFTNVLTFNLDEYWPMEPDSIHSYNRFMWENLFHHINIPKENVHIPDGTVPLAKVEAWCDDYERKIQEAGGLDIQLLGIGRTGHIGFNEPGSSRNSTTRLVALDPKTRKDAAGEFYGEENVPMQAVTMGVNTIMNARQIIMLALGEHKSKITRIAVEDEVTDQVPSTFLQKHPNSMFVIDSAAASQLTAVRIPWMAGLVEWTPLLVKKAVIWLSQRVKKPLLKLEEADFMENHLINLLRACNKSCEEIVHEVFLDMQSGICNKPGGDKPITAICFSPHPDDDVISMGGTLITLADQGHDMHIAYMTSGNIAVFDEDASRHTKFVNQFLELFKLDSGETAQLYKKLMSDLEEKIAGEPDSPEIQSIKGLIRKTEAAAGAIQAGVPESKLHFLDMPFYQTGDVKKNPIGEADVEIVANLLRELKPDQIYVAGDLSDPHGTHRVCAQAIIKALDVVKAEGIETEVWLYRGAWEEYEPHEIERAVPLSPAVVHRKRTAIFAHESQKDQALFPGSDAREFWVRAEDRTTSTARVYDELGLPEFYALEGFVQYRGQL
ncbi:Glucosamine-6-phosphate deaminase 1 [Polystyrenella longa]|uniref:Glucosamine-6-phosphate deaminase n=1 Tax=Polystyrenella longa TaxID=2528007 RepID=A0A518CKI7_9PLAN|nr:glucosamine-6-phosphate deaminase [Polystyrenella longa]QDU79732.1 Glucosamine-6-phosphate deaminase 1 [Polystyrenella longa]